MALAMGMKLDKDFLLDYHLESNNQLRLLHYPSAPRGDFDSGKKGRINAHTDFGTYVYAFNAMSNSDVLLVVRCCSRMTLVVLRSNRLPVQASSSLLHP